MRLAARRRSACCRTGGRSRCRGSARYGISGGNGATVLRGGYGHFATVHVATVEAGTTLFIPPNAYSRGGGCLRRFDSPATGLTYDTVPPGPLCRCCSARRPSTRRRRVSQVPEDGQLQRVDCEAHGLEPDHRGRVRRHERTRPRQSINENVVPFGALSRGVLGTPISRCRSIASTSIRGLINTLRPFPAYGPVYDNEFEGRSQYDSLQVTVSRQTGRHLQYLPRIR